MEKNTLDIIQILLARLERISVDSVWAHRASGIRGALLRIHQQMQVGINNSEKRIENLIDEGFYILNKSIEVKGAASPRFSRRR